MILSLSNVAHLPGKINSDPSPDDLITEGKLREVLEPQVVDELIDHQRHYEDSDGARYWVRSDCQDLLGAIKAGEGVQR